MRTGIAGATLLAALTVSSGLASAQDQCQSESFAPGVTVHHCNEIDAFEVRRILSLEHWGEADTTAEVRIDCRSSTVTVRVFSREHPRGRVGFLDLSRVEAVARARTVALVVTEMWQAPVPEVPARAASYEAGSEADLRRELRYPSASYRERSSFGFRISTAERNARRTRGGRQGWSRSMMPTLAFDVDLPIASWIGFFGSYEHSLSGEMAVNDGRMVAVEWSRAEVGSYIPLLRRELTLDLRFSIGGDQVESAHAASPMGPGNSIYPVPKNDVLAAVEPSYAFRSAGLEGSYAAGNKVILSGHLATYGVERAFGSPEINEPTGYRWGVAVHYLYRPHLQLNVLVDSARYYFEVGADSYSDDLFRMGVGLSFLR